MGFFEWIGYEESSFQTRLGILKRWSGIAIILKFPPAREGRPFLLEYGNDNLAWPERT